MYSHTNSIYIVLLLWLMGASSLASAQSVDILELEEAIVLAIENNREIQILEKQKRIAENNVFPGNAGLLPTVQLIGQADYQVNDASVRIRTFQEEPLPASVTVEDNAAATTTYQAALQAEYVLLGGFTGKYQFRMLKSQRDLAYHQQEVVINQTVLAVSELFLGLAQLQRQEELLLESIDLGEKRIQRMKDRFDFGQTSELAVLQVQTEVNTDRSTLNSLRINMDELRKDLNYLMGIAPEKTYRAQAQYVLPTPAPLADLSGKLRANNPELKLAKAGIAVSQHQLDMSRSYQLPNLRAFANYGYFNQENDLQQLARLETFGPQVGVALRYNIFNGGKTRRSMQNAAIGMEVSSLRYQQKEEELISSLNKAQQKLSLLQQQLILEEKNLETFEENFQRTEDRFLQGNATSLEVREAQTAKLRAEVLINNRKTEILLTSLVQQSLTGDLLQRNATK
ncbi:MAG: TolC family protein [Bacteroidota bacterium]